MFLSGSFVTALGLVTPHSPLIDVRAYAILAGAQVGLALLVLAFPRRLGKHFIPAFVVVVGIIIVSICVVLNGERNGGPAALNELFYIWPALYVGYFFNRVSLILSMALVGVAYAGVLALIGLDFTMASTRWILTLTAVSGAAGVLHAIRRRVDGLLGQLREAARTDPLTGLLNRRGFQEACATELRAAARNGLPCSLLLGDLDNFKRLNDSFGHAAGDAALVAVADRLSAACRPRDLIARVGGEEFAILLPETSREAAVAVAERMRVNVRGTSVTTSFGVATSPGDGENLDALLRASDGALYAAKHAGRDRTVASEPAVESPSWTPDDIAVQTPG
ncbi:MAG: hypothetical protein QOG63_1543 [Thermoleophilaceae bacterium]|jgi:diguanylate cyclase (GGDEF)-like protein|nr:hypothetical protein [Thermoleophilaceae bacterium]